MAYSTERRAAVLRKLQPPNALPVRQLAKDEGISEATLHAWRREARSQGRLLPDADAGPGGVDVARQVRGRPRDRCPERGRSRHLLSPVGPLPRADPDLADRLRAGQRLGARQ
ncbi:transposase [Siccirubricoccus deserti]|uniref:Transposase n=1 Tax=Siccirubricoccus deserti TaxID=2013562 RepID=A0A9X0R3C8_9PROT|nr:transposase [Siccirubricoccus deserti]